MVNVAKKASFILIGSLIVFAFALYLFPCMLCHDDFGGESKGCDTATCQCPCTISIAEAGKYLEVDGPGASEKAMPYYLLHKTDNLSFEFYRPPERQAS